ncbi:MAG TPA: hypothetical protein VGE77_00685 [Nocardioides sp.]
MGDRTWGRWARLVIGGGLGGGLLAALIGGAVGAYAGGGLPLWVLVLALAVLVPAAVWLAVVVLREFVVVIQTEVLAPYGLSPPRMNIWPAVAVGLLVPVVIGILVTDILPTPTRWIVVALLVVGGAWTSAIAWRAGAEGRRAVKEARRERGYLLGEQPWSWWVHAGYALFAVAILVLQVWNAVGAGSDQWFFWAGVVLFSGLVVSVAWSAVQKRRRERRGGSSGREASA